ncbi:uncharacterized protein BDW70DRAFT_161965 [Aspergillus foveolatus]|uniref:uncharacterized protein n=1 Tax=Aspergillus foveolatus TaxID=210207 RepID=UPI003CCD1386
MNEYAWIEELYKLGYSVDNIAELLIENAKDSPWIYLEAKSYDEAELQHGLHLRDCAHQFSFNRRLSQGQSLTTETVSRTEIVQEIQELCGLAGITPGSPELRSRTGSVKFEEQNSVAIISYAINGNEHDLDGNSIVFRLYRIIDRLSSAAGRVQSAGLCCDCFTIIRFPDDQPNPELSLVNQVEMCCMEFELTVQMKTELQHLLGVECIKMQTSPVYEQSQSGSSNFLHQQQDISLWTRSTVFSTIVA